MTIKLDVTQRTQIANATSTIECMVNCRQGTQGIGTRHPHLTQYVNLNGACLSQRRPYLRILVESAQSGTDAVLRCANLQAADLDGTELRDIDVTLRAYRQSEVFP